MSHQRAKITVVGAGNVGASCAAWMAERDLGDIVLLDIPVTKDMPKGKALDLLQVGPISGYNSRLKGTTDYADTDKFGCVRHHRRRAPQTRHEPGGPGGREPGHRRGVTKELVAKSPNAILVSSPTPSIPCVTWPIRPPGFLKNRVLGQAGVLDGARMRTFLAEAAQVAVENVTAGVIGGHGDEMVPLVRYSTIAGLPITSIS